MRVIQDSDDDDIEEVVEVLKPPEKAVVADAAPGEPTTNNDSSTGTGSTESLKRAFAEAHRNHLQSHPRSSATSHQAEPRSSAFLHGHESMNCQTNVAPSPLESPSTGSAKRGPITYGKQSKPVFSSPYMDLSDEQIGCDVIDASKEATPDEAAWVVGTIREDYAQHNPNALLPEPSSTIPNATATQQRLLDGVAGPAFLGQESEPDGRRFEPPQPSVPWSDLLKLTPINSTERSDSSNQQLESEPGPPLVQTPRKPHEGLASQSSAQRGSPLRNEVPLECLDPLDTLRPPIEPFSSQDLGLPPTASAKTPKAALRKARTSSLQKKNRQSSLPNSDDDFTATGLPKEQYKPRPSRSRSLKVDTQDSVDYSVRPEKTGRVSKRRKTTHAATSAEPISAHISTTPEKIQQFCDMGFTPSTTRAALKQNNGDVTRTIDSLVGEDELAHHNTPQKKLPSRALKTDQATSTVISHKIASPDPEAKLDIEEIPIMDNPRLADELESLRNVANNTILSPEDGTHATPAQTKTSVQALIPMKSPRPKSTQEPGLLLAQSKKAKRRKTTSDLPEPPTDGDIIAAPRSMTEKKKGRGRPKKVPNAPAVIVSMQDLSEEKHTKVIAGDVLQITEVIATTPELPHDRQEVAIDTPKEPSTHVVEESQDRPPTPTSLSNKASPSAHSRTPDPTSKPSNSSSVTKGKVPYRVGLSRRQRLPSLLRIVKK